MTHLKSLILLGESAIDSYGAPAADPIGLGDDAAFAAADSYGAPAADPISSGSAAPVVSAADDYGAPQGEYRKLFKEKDNI